MYLSELEITVLRETFLFHHMTPNTYIHFVRAEQPEFQRRVYQPAQAVELPSQGERCVGIVISGVLAASQGERMPDLILDEGFVIGALDLFSSGPMLLPPITAREESQLLLISRSQMRRLFTRYPEIMERYIFFLTGQLHALKWENSLAGESSGEGRLLRFLAAQSQGPEGAIALELSYSALATRLHMSRSSLYRAMDALEQSGLLRREGRTLYLTSIPPLSQQRFL